MKVWHVTYSCLGFNLNAVVVHRSRGEAIALLHLGPDCREVESFEIGTAHADSPYVVCEDKLEVA